MENKAIEILRKIYDYGSFFTSCIEFDAFDERIDGEEIEKEIKEVLKIWTKNKKVLKNTEK